MRRRRITWHENVVQGSIERRVSLWYKHRLEGDCLEVGILPVMTQIPL